MTLLSARELLREFARIEGHSDNDGTMPETYYSVQEVCEMMGWTRQWVSKLILQGRLQAVKDGKEWRIPEGAWNRIKEVPQGRPRLKRRGRPKSSTNK